MTMKEQMEAELQEMIRTLEKANGALARIFNVEEDYLANDCIKCGREFNYREHKSDTCIYCEGEVEEK